MVEIYECRMGGFRRGEGRLESVGESRPLRRALGRRRWQRAVLRDEELFMGPRKGREKNVPTEHPTEHPPYLWTACAAWGTAALCDLSDHCSSALYNCVQAVAA